MATELGVAYLSILPETSKIAPGIKTALGATGGAADKAGRSLGERFSGVMSKAVKGGMLAVGATATGVLGTALFKGFGRLSAIDQAQAKLRGLGNSTKTVTKIMDNALASVKGTAFGLDEAATTAGSVVAAGIKPGKQLQGVLKTVADTATIAGTSMSDMGLIFGSVAARGKLQGDDLMQLQSRGIPVLALLAKHYGVTAQAASAMVSAGKVDFKAFAAAMHDGMGGAALQSGKTVKGALANTQAALGRLGASLLTGVFAKLPGLLARITSGLDALGPVATTIGAKIGNAFNGIGKVVGPIADDLRKKLQPAFEAIVGWAKKNPATVKAFAVALGVLAGAIGLVTVATTAFSIALNSTGIPLIVIGIAALVAGIVYAYKKFSGFRSIVNSIGGALKYFGSWIKSVALPAVLDFAAKIGTNLKPILTAIGDVFRKDIVPILRDNVIPLIQQVAGKFRDWWPTIQKVISAAARLEAKWLEFVAKIAGKVLPVVIKFAGWLLNKLVPAALRVVTVVAKIISGVVSFGAKLVQAGVKVVEFAAKVNDRIGKIVTWFIKLPGRIVHAVGDLGKLLYGAGKDVISGLWNGISHMWDSIKDKVADIGHKVAGAVKGALGINSPSRVFHEIGTQVVAGFVNGVDQNAHRAQQSMQQLSAPKVASIPRGAPMLHASEIRTSTATPPTDAAAAGIHIDKVVAQDVNSFVRAETARKRRIALGGI